MTADQDLRALAQLERMFAEAPRDWWRFVPCGYCNQGRQEPCIQGGWGTGLAHRPHAARVRSGQVLHGTLWLLANGFQDDVLGALDADQ